MLIRCNSVLLRKWQNLFFYAASIAWGKSFSVSSSNSTMRSCKYSRSFLAWAIASATFLGSSPRDIWGGVTLPVVSSIAFLTCCWTAFLAWGSVGRGSGTISLSFAWSCSCCWIIFCSFSVGSSGFLIFCPTLAALRLDTSPSSSSPFSASYKCSIF